MRRDEAYLLDMLMAAKDAMRFVGGMDRRQFEASDLHHYAVMKAIENLGEAAGRVSSETKSAHPDIPWAGIVGMRNRLIHGYFDVDLVKVWDTVRDDLPPLIALLEPLVPADDG